MGKKKTILLVLVLAVLLGGAYLLYNRLSRQYAPDQLAVRNTTASESERDEETASQEGTENTTKSIMEGITEDITGNITESITENITGNITESITEEESESAGKDTADKEHAPDFTVYDFNGSEVHLSDYVGTPVVLNFWASWCGPCKSEMADFQDAYEELGDKVQFLMINMTDGLRETKAGASEFIEEQGYTFPVFYDTKSDASMVYEVYAIPMTCFIDKEGTIAAQATGAISGEVLQRGISMIAE